MNDPKLANIADLALHPSTPELEWQAAAIAFFRVLRNRNAESNALSLNQPATPKPQPKSRACDRKMPFGKYRGAYLSDIPSDYLDFLASCHWLRDPLRTHVINELDARVD